MISNDTLRKAEEALFVVSRLGEEAAYLRGTQKSYRCDLLTALAAFFEGLVIHPIVEHNKNARSFICKMAAATIPHRSRDAVRGTMIAVGWLRSLEAECKEHRSRAGHSSAMVANDSGTLRRTALYDAHLALGGRMVPFGGFEMPVQYAGILKEHDAVRSRAGLFDLSHMGQFALTGADVGTWAETLTINKVANMQPGQARYNVFTNDHGGAHDDVIFYRLGEERWLLVVNASNADKMWAHVSAHRSGDVTLTDLRGGRALIAIQGPRSVEWLQPFVKAELAPMKYYSCAETTVRGTREPIVVARTGYTGEDGFELFLPSEDATAVWDALLAANRAAGLEPCGLGARDVLRLEAGMPLYGHEMDEDITPLQAGIGWAIKFDKPAFLGKDALLAQREAGDYARIVGLSMDGRVPARSGYAVHAGGVSVGEIRSGSWGPSVGKNIATALVAASASSEGTALDVEVRGTHHAARVEPMPFYRRPKA